MKANIILIIGILVLPNCFNKAQNINVQLPLSITYDLSYYLNSVGGNTANGCQAWATVLSTKEYIYTSKCDTLRLANLSFNIQEALKFNRLLPSNQQISQSEEYYMVDFTDIKHQALFGKTQNKVLTRIILNDKKQNIYLKMDGTVSQLKECGINIDDMLEKNSSMPDEFKISIINDNVSYVKNVLSKQAYLLGSNNFHEVIALVFSEKGAYMGFSVKK
jgi:hypothetical protein